MTQMSRIVLVNHKWIRIKSKLDSRSGFGADDISSGRREGLLCYPANQTVMSAAPVALIGRIQRDQHGPPAWDARMNRQYWGDYHRWSVQTCVRQMIRPLDHILFHSGWKAPYVWEVSTPTGPKWHSKATNTSKKLKNKSLIGVKCFEVKRAFHFQ